ncbi:hypothetical protein GTV15_07000, partial [Streptomyces sp. SID7803]|nr:hypothetical protein [Streptomyces sp. SID7803]
MGLVPPRPQRPGEARGDRVPQRHGGPPARVESLIMQTGSNTVMSTEHFGTLADGTAVHRWT